MKCKNIEIKRATPELLRTEVMEQIIPPNLLNNLSKRLSEGIIMNLIICDTVPVGLVGLMDLQGNELKAIIHEDYRRNGYSFEACIKTINEGFNEHSLQKISAKTLENTLSHKLAEKLGFSNVAINQCGKLAFVDVCLSKNDWQSNAIYN